ncbi:MAG: hypothetical protein IPM20_12055 [Gammaproteobacteria bacterium]|nr:hypothetical protein [Gammaproteobacteria bacterium]
MKKTKRAISSIYMFTASPIAPALALGILLTCLAGCAGSAAMQKPAAAGQSGESAAANAELSGCRAAIDDVTRYCSGDDASTGKCNDAKARTRQLCIN